MKKYLKGSWLYILLFLIIIMIFLMTSMPNKQAKEIYSDLVVKIQNQEVTELQVVDDVATAKLKDEKTITVEVPGYETLKSDVGSVFDEQVKAGTLKVDTPLPYSPPWWLTLLPTLGLIVIFGVFWFIMMQ
ncbi:MAG: ATP-dependent metallopeptidase FtsH/Yme1/Tma family protein, partial [Oscillospiraceae bacterium]